MAAMQATTPATAPVVVVDDSVAIAPVNANTLIDGDSSEEEIVPEVPETMIDGDPSADEDSPPMFRLA